MTIDRGKYVSFKRSELNAVIGELVLVFDTTLHARLTEAELDDAVVIRKKDVFAASALYSYATACQSAIELLEHAQAGVVVDQHVLEHLSELADFFAGEADHARQLNGRIPC